MGAELLIIFFLLGYYVLGWVHAAMHCGFPSDMGLLRSILLWPLYYIPNKQGVGDENRTN